MPIIAVIGPDSAALVAGLSQQLVGQPGAWGSSGGLLFHHDSQQTLYVGLTTSSLHEPAQLAQALLLFLTSDAVVWALPPGAPLGTPLLGALRLLQQAKQLLLPSLAQLAAEALPPLLLLVSQAPQSLAAVLTPEVQQQAQAQLDTRLRTLLKLGRALLPGEHAAALCTLPPQHSAVWLLAPLGQSQAAAVQQAFAALQGGATAASPGSNAAALQQLRSLLKAHVAGCGVAERGGAKGFSAWRTEYYSLAAALQCAEAAGLAPDAVEAAEAAGSTAAAGDAAPEGAAAALAWLQGCAGLTQQASEARCQRAAAAGREAYLKTVPQHGVYPAAVHAAALEGALRMYAALARGPASVGAEARLRGECEAHWRDGRQQCGARSVWGRPCVLALHDPQEVPHSSGHVLQLATPNGQEQVEVPDPFPPSPGSHLPLAAPVQPGSSGSSSSGAQPAAAAAATVPLLLRQVGAAATAADGTAALRVAAAAAPSGCSVEVHVLGGSKAAAAGLQQPGLLPGSSALHRFALQTSSSGGEEPPEDFPALALPEPAPASAPAAPAVLNWPGGATAAPGGAAAAAAQPAAGAAGPKSAQLPTPSKPAAGRQSGKRGGGAAGRAGAPGQPPVLLVGIEYELPLGDRAIITPAQLASCTASSLDTVVVQGSTLDGGSGSSSGLAPADQLQPLRFPLTDALADAAAEVVGAAAAAASAAARKVAVAAGGGAPPAASSTALGGPAAEFMLSTTLPLYLQASSEQLAGGRAKGAHTAKGSGRGRQAAAGAGGGSNAAAVVWWQLRRVYVATPALEGLHFQACPQLRLEFPGGLRQTPAEAAEAPASSSAAGTSMGPSSRPAVLLYQPERGVRLPPDSLCCIALPWLYTLPGGAPLQMGAAALRAVLLGGTAVAPES